MVVSCKQAMQISPVTPAVMQQQFCPRAEWWKQLHCQWVSEWNTEPRRPPPASKQRCRIKGGYERTRLSVSTPPWPPGVQQPESLNEIFKSLGFYLQCVGRDAQSAWYDVMPAAWLVRAELCGQVTRAAVGLLRHYGAPRLHIRLVCYKLWSISAGGCIFQAKL